MKNKYIISIYFGLPGSGKTTIAANIARKCKRKGIDVYSNVPIKGTNIINPAFDLGIYQVENCKLIIDEAGIEYNNRNYKTFTDANNKFFKLHRHYKVSIDVFSQSFNDMDKKIRLLHYIGSMYIPGKWQYKYCPYNYERSKCRIWNCEKHFINNKYSKDGKCNERI